MQTNMNFDIMQPKESLISLIKELGLKVTSDENHEVTSVSVEPQSGNSFHLSTSATKGIVTSVTYECGDIEFDYTRLNEHGYSEITVLAEGQSHFFEYKL